MADGFGVGVLLVGVSVGRGDWCVLGVWSGIRLELRGGIRSGKVSPVAAERDREVEVHGVRLILENSTVCHSRRISLLCPVFCGLLVMGFGFLW